MTLTNELAFSISKKFILDTYNERGGFYSVFEGTSLRVSKNGEYRRYTTHRDNPVITLYKNSGALEETIILNPVVRLIDGERWAFDTAWYWLPLRAVEYSDNLYKNIPLGLFDGREVKPFHYKASKMRCSVMRLDA